MQVKSPIKGKTKKLKKLNDGVFSEKIMGDGICIVPQDNIIYAPISGKMVSVFPTGHAYGIEGKDGTNVLIHIGLDTVNLKGEGFTPLIKQGKKVKCGQQIAKVEFDKIKDKVPSIDVITIVTLDSKTKPKNIIEEQEVTIEDTIFETI